MDTADAVLIVDDEEMVRTVAEIVLRQAGYRVVTAADAAAGLEAFRREAGRLAAVVLDLSLPDRPGADLLADLRALDPAVRVVLASGGDPPDDLPAGPTAFLPKPFDRRALLAAVRGESP